MGIRVNRLTEQLKDLSAIIADQVTAHVNSTEQMRDIICLLICNKGWTANEVIKTFQLSGTPLEDMARRHEEH